MVQDLSREFGEGYNEELRAHDKFVEEYDCNCQFCACAWKLANNELSTIPPDVTQWRQQRNWLPMMINALEQETDGRRNELQIAQLNDTLAEAHRPENIYSNECKLHSPFPRLEDYA